MNNSIIN